jgi:peroxiredoxin
MNANLTTYKKTALQPGDVFPDFSLIDSADAVVSSAKLLGRGPLIVSFYPDPLELNALSLALPEIREMRGALVAIAAGMMKETSAIMAKFGLNFYSVTDHQGALARKAGLLQRRPVVLRADCGKANLSLPIFCGSWEFRIPATYTVGQDRIIKDRFFGTGYYQPVKSTGLISDLETPCLRPQMAAENSPGF